MKAGLIREIKILSIFLIFGLLLYTDSTAVKPWKYPLELSPENKQIEKIVSLYLLYYGYLSVAFIRLMVYLIRSFIRYISR